MRDPVVIDEVQRVPELLLAIKAAVDRDRRPGRFLLTGSASVMMLPAVADSLAGRMEVISLLAARSANLLNLAEVSRALGLSRTTLNRHFALLEMLFLVERLPAWDRNPGKRLVKSPKVFVRDTGLLAHLRGSSAEALAAAPGLPGALVEGFVLEELRKHLAFSTRGLRLHHYRTQAGAEVDFVLESRAGERLVAIEVKASATLGSTDFKGLRHLKETEPAFARGVVLYAGRELVPFAPDLFAVPLSMWWATVPG